jgi:hypothetical protein
MSGVFRNIDPPPPRRPASVYPAAFGGGGGGRTHSLGGERVGGGVNSSEDARHGSVHYIYVSTLCTTIRKIWREGGRGLKPGKIE